MNRALKGSAVALAIALTACFHATVETGLPPSPQTIDKPWASGWVFGLVPPSPVSTIAQCPNGASKVETQLSFVNMLVAALTLDIYTPMSIKVTCAASGHASIPAGASTIQVGTNPTPQQLQDALMRAVAQSVTSGVPVYIEH